MGPSKRKGSVRRPVLDLNAKEGSPSSSRLTWQNKYQHVLPGGGVHHNGDLQTSSSPVTKSNPLSGLLGNYNSDSDSEEPAQQSNSNLDAKVEDFFKEIQSIASNHDQKETVSQSKTHKEPLYPPSVTAWQQCYDQNSGYPYYWNTETNEVTWEMPADLKAAIASVALKQQQEQQQQQQQQQSQPPLVQEPKKKVCKYPWQTESDSEDEKIEMITSFGPQSGEESEEEEKVSSKVKKVGAVASRVPGVSLPHYSSKIGSDCISLAPEDPEALNESSYETSSLLTHGVQDTGPPGDDSFQSAKESVTSYKVSASKQKEEAPTVESKGENTSNSQAMPVESSSFELNAQVESVEFKNHKAKKEDVISESKLSENIADTVIAQIEKETPPDYKDDLETPKEESEPEKQTTAQDANSQVNASNSSFALIANYGDDSEPEDNTSFNEKQKTKSKIKSTPLFPIEIPQEKPKTLFPCMGVEGNQSRVDAGAKESQEESEPLEPVSNIYNMEMDLDDPAAHKAFKRKKRIEFATTIYGPSTSKAPEMKPTSPDLPVTGPITQYNMDPDSNEHRGFGFNALKAQDCERKTYKNYGGIQFIKAETINLNPSPKEKTDTETDTAHAPGSSSKDPMQDGEIEDAATLLREKVNFLTGGNELISPIQQMAIELETLVSAWQQGALTPLYLMRWLNEKCGELIRHEKTAAPSGWTCLWDRKNKRYYYRNATTKAIQWEYPNAVEEKKKPKNGEIDNGGDEMDICDTPPHSSPTEPDKQRDEPPSTPPPPVISDVSENVSSPSPIPQAPPPPQISFSSDVETSKIGKKRKRKADEVSEAEEDTSTTPSVSTYERSENVEAAPPLPPMPPPPPPPPDESPPPLPDSPPPLSLDPNQPLPPGVDEPEYSLYRHVSPKHSYKKAQPDATPYSAELMMTYGYGLPVQQVVPSGTQAMTMQMQPLEYHTYMHEAVSNSYLVQSAPTSHVIHCPAKKPKPSLTSELVSFYSDLAMLECSPADSSNSNSQVVVPSTAAPVTSEPFTPPVQTVSTASSTISSVVTTTVKATDSVTSNGVNTKKKKKAKATSGLALKKKGVSSLVAKWQQVQQEVRKDFSDDDDDVAETK